MDWEKKSTLCELNSRILLSWVWLFFSDLTIRGPPSANEWKGFVSKDKKMKKGTIVPPKTSFGIIRFCVTEKMFYARFVISFPIACLEVICSIIFDGHSESQNLTLSTLHLSALCSLQPSSPLVILDLYFDKLQS